MDGDTVPNLLIRYSILYRYENDLIRLITPEKTKEERSEFFLRFFSWGEDKSHYTRLKNAFTAIYIKSPHTPYMFDEDGNPIKAGDEDRRYFEGPWMHKYNGKYYLSYSTGTTHYLVYATSDSPAGPFTYGGRIMEPVLGWTTHHSIVEYKGKWYLFYHDCELSNGINHRRCVKFTELKYNPDGSIITIKPYEE